MQKRTLTTGDIAKYCDVHFRTVSRWISQGHLKAYQLPGRGNNRVTIVDFKAFLKTYEMPVPDDLKLSYRRVLIADDDERMAKSIQRVLKRQGFETAIAPDGLRTGLMLAEFRPTVMTLDLKMPGASGLDVLEFARRTDYLAHLKILVVSAMPQEQLDQARAYGADDVLAKPFSNEDLVAKVCKLAE